jgi:hypothetical protein
MLAIYHLKGRHECSSVLLNAGSGEENQQQQRQQQAS